MEDARFELVIVPTPGAVPIRLPARQGITTVGSGPEADVRLHTVPAEWAALSVEAEGAELRVLASGARHALSPGARVEVDGVSLGLEAAEPAGGGAPALERLAAELAACESPERALARLLEGALEISGADSGAVIVTEEGDYRVAIARDAAGRALEGAADLLSDTIVRDVLQSGERLLLADVGESERYGAVPSVVSMHLLSVLCLPMRLEGRTLGALFLGKGDRRDRFSARAALELEALAAMAVPFLSLLRRAGAAPKTPAGERLLGDSTAMSAVRALVARVAPSDLSVLVRGASGTGKELVARAIHEASPRKERAMVTVNCAAVPESLLDAELFGYKKGAFTGAAGDRKGLIEAADGSTLFLDEIGDMPLAMQAALLRVLEQREVKRLGENRVRKVDFRLVAATHRDLDAEVAAGRFREDLLFRLREVTIELPPLRDREGDLELLAGLFLRQTESQLSLRPHRLSPEALARLQSHPWPGNVRELRATIRRAAILADGEAIEPAHLQLGGGGGAPAAPGGALALGDLDRPLAAARDDFVRRYVAAALERHGGDKEAAAEALGIGVRTLYRYL